jgi:solute carrier family 25 2-oxodicarboxylate transporter 21
MAKEHLGRYANTLDCLGQVLRQEGPAALFIGIAPTLWRNCLWNGVYYGTTHELDRWGRRWGARNGGRWGSGSE